MRIHLEANCARILTAWLFVPGCCFGSEIVDNFSNGAIGWTSAPKSSWTVIQPSPGVFAYRGDYRGDALTHDTNMVLGTSWAIDVDSKVQNFYADNNSHGVSGLPLFSVDSIEAVADIDQLTDGSLLMTVLWLDTTNQVWHTVFNTGWITGQRSSQYHLQIARFSGSDSIGFTVSSANGFSFRTNSPSFPVGFLDRMKYPGLAASYGQVDFSRFRVVTPIAGFDVARDFWSPIHGFRLKVIPPVGTPVQIESSNNLTNWTPVAVFPNLAEPLEFFDPSATNFQSLFYRVVEP